MVGQERPNRPCESSAGWRKASPGAQSWRRKPQMAASSGGNRQAVQGPQRGRGRIAMKVDGGCHCGKIRYEAEVDPGNVLICHCTDCQTMSRSAFRTVVPSNAGAFLSGTPRVYAKTAESGRRRKANLLRRLRLADLLCHRRWRYQGRWPPRRHDPSARPADPERSILGALIAAVAPTPGEDEKEAKAAELRPQRRVS